MFYSNLNVIDGSEDFRKIALNLLAMIPIATHQTAGPLHIKANTIYRIVSLNIMTYQYRFEDKRKLD